MRLLREAAKRDCNITDLKAAVKKGGKVRHAGGRPLREPKTARGGLCDLRDLSKKWLQYDEKVWSKVVEDKLKNLAVSEQGEVLSLLPEVRDMLQRLNKATISVEKFLNQLEAKLKAGRSSAKP